MLILELKNPARYVSYGQKNADKIFYVAEIATKEAGLFAIIRTSLGHITYAVRHHYIPIIDMQNHPNQYLPNDKLYKDNAWEYYFEQPAKYTLVDIRESKKIILNNTLPSRYWITNTIYRNTSRLAYFRRMFREYIHFNKSTQVYLDTDYQEIIADKRVLGVLCRGSDYLVGKAHAHPVQPPSDVIKMSKDILEQYKCSHIYLATEDTNIYKLFLEHFGEKLLVNKQQRISNPDIFLRGARLSGTSYGAKYQIGLDYLSSINILSKCACFIGGNTSGTIGVCLMASDFEFTYIYSLGVYG
jgi:hypothetical protein